MIRSLASISLLLALLPSLALAQFGFFDGMFGQQRQQQQQQQQRGGVSQWAAVADSIPCSQYLCPGTLECVAQPILCPCPYAEDYKCIIPELDKDGNPEKMGGAAVVCVRGKEGCEQVMKLL